MIWDVDVLSLCGQTSVVIEGAVKWLLEDARVQEGPICRLALSLGIL